MVIRIRLGIFVNILGSWSCSQAVTGYHRRRDLRILFLLKKLQQRIAASTIAEYGQRRSLEYLLEVLYGSNFNQSPVTFGKIRIFKR